MRMKRTIASLLALTMVATIGTSMASAATGTVGINVGKVEAAPGATFSVDVNLAAIPTTGLTTVDFAVEFDSSLLTITSVTAGALCDTGAAAAEKAINPAMGEDLLEWNVVDDQVCLVWTTGLTDATYWMKGEGVFVTLTGTVKSTATAGATADLKVVPVGRDAYSGSGTANADILVGYVDANNKAENYTAAITNGWVKVAGASSVMYGDVDVNGIVDINDLVLLNRVLSLDSAFSLTDEGKLNADVENDGKVTNADSVKLMQYLSQAIAYSELGK